MRKSLKQALLGGALALVAVGAEAATTEEWRRDADAIVNDVLAHHPAPFAKVGEFVWRKEAAEFREKLPGLSEPERVVRLMQLIAMIGDGHTSIQLTGENYARWYPVRLYQFSDGYFVTSAHKSEKDLAGAQILTIAGRPVEEAMMAARALFGADNEFDAKERLYAAHNAYLMQALGFTRADGSLEATFRLRSGATVKRILMPRPADELRMPKDNPVFDWTFVGEVYGLPFGSHEDWISAYKDLPAAAFRELDLTRPPFLQYRRLFTKRSIADRDAYYIQANAVSEQSMIALMNEALAEVDALKPRRLIIDVRYNGGGDGSTLTPMIHEFIRRKADPSWKELYIITGRKTFSAGVMAVDAFTEHTNATLVGEPAGAPLTSSGDATARPYEALGLTLNVSTLRHQLGESNDLRSFIPVDTPAPMSSADYGAGRDPAVDPILAGQEMRSIPAVALADGGDAAREAWQERKKKFADVEWLTPPTEIALRRVIDALIGEKRFDDAVETARLSTEIHPYIWNAWQNLGHALTAAGRKEESFASYKCVVVLEPNNWNAPTIEKLFADNNVSPKPAAGCPAGENS